MRCRCGPYRILQKTNDWKPAWHIPREFHGLGPRMLNGNKTPAVGPIENKDLKAAWHILKEFHGLVPRELNGNKTPTVGPIENKDFQAAQHKNRGNQIVMLICAQTSTRSTL